uniref:Acetyltransferase n=1 Tax=Oryza glumipatula TaxID=40148 RepID=A0A0D9ZJN9_9ORYZ
MGGTALNTRSSPRFDVFGNDFGWGRPTTVRSGGTNKFNDKVTVYEGPTGARSMSLENICGIHIVSRRMVRPAAEHAGELPEHETVHHLTPLDLRMITGDYVQKGVVLPKPPGRGEHVVEHLVSSFARALARFYPLASRLAVADADTPSSTADIADSLYVPRVVWSFFPLNGMLGTDAAVEPRRPVLAAQVTELADGMFIAMSLNHGVADGFTFWHLFRTWSEINRRRSGDNADLELSTPPPVFDRWFVDGIPAPIPLPFAKLEDMVRRPLYTPVEECFLHFSAESVRTLKEKANAEMAGGGGAATAAISSLQSVVAHIWRAVCRARRLAPELETRHGLSVGLRARVKEVPQEYMGNTVVGAVARATAGELLGRGLGWAAWLLNRAVASAGDEANVRRMLPAWPETPRFVTVASLQNAGVVVISGSPRFDVFGNDFGWGTSWTGR